MAEMFGDPVRACWTGMRCDEGKRTSGFCTDVRGMNVLWSLLILMSNWMCDVCFECVDF